MPPRKRRSLARMTISAIKVFRAPSTGRLAASNDDHPQMRHSGKRNRPVSGSSNRADWVAPNDKHWTNAEIISYELRGGSTGGEGRAAPSVFSALLIVLASFRLSLGCIAASWCNIHACISCVMCLHAKELLVEDNFMIFVYGWQ